MSFRDVIEEVEELEANPCIKKFINENEDGVDFGDYFYLRYCDINIFFKVCRTDKHEVCIYELQKSRAKINGKTCDVINEDLRGARNPLVVLENNCWSKSNFWVRTTNKGGLLIPVPMCGPLYNAALKKGYKYPHTGFFIAIPLKEEREAGILNFYWDK